MIIILFCFLISMMIGAYDYKFKQISPMRTPKQMWENIRKKFPPFLYFIEKDKIVKSNTTPSMNLRRLQITFTSQVIEEKRMGHRAVIFMPADSEVYQRPNRRGKVVIITHRFGDKSIEGNYAEPIAARTGYPTMDLLLPGDYGGNDGEGKWLRYFRKLALETQDPSYHDFIRLAIPYLQALDIFSDLFKEKKIRAIIGGHSKRAYYAYTAAAMDPDRIASVIFMGCERVYVRKEFPVAVNPFTTQKYVNCPVFYIGATNEDGYEMFNINKIQERMERQWTIEYIPNYRHASRSEKQFMDWQMWVAHIFDGRPITKISNLSYEETGEGTIFRARIDTPNKIIQVKVWYVYCDDVPYWRDLMWYPEIMKLKEGNLYEGYVEGKLPDAWLVEVKDIAYGFPGYISSLPQDITHKPTKERKSRGSRSRNWEPKIKKKEGN